MDITTKLFWALALIYLSITSLLFLQKALPHADTLTFFYPNQSIVNTIEVAQSLHRAPYTKSFAKIFYNKPLGFLQAYLDTVYRTVDIPFLFTMTTESSMYENQGPRDMLFPLELPFFSLALIFLVRTGNKKYLWLSGFCLVAILLPSFFLPVLSQIKLFPLILGIRLLIIFGLYEGVQKWLKK